METIDSVRLALRKNDWAISVDLKDAYFHILIHRKSRRYLRFHFMGRTYQFRALAFGLSPAPYVFTRVVKMVVKHCRRQGMRLHAYLDDWLQPSTSQSLSIQHRDQLLCTVLSLGFVPNWDKSELIPSQMFCFLGARIDLEKGMIGPSPDRIVRLQTIIQKMLASHSASAPGSSFCTRTDGICGPSPSLWPGSQAFTTMACERPVVSGNPVLGLPYFTGSLVQTSSRAMAEQGFSSCYGSTGSSTTRLLSVHGCESGGLGRPSGRSLSFKPVVCSMEQRTHKCSGTPSSLVSSEVLSSGNFRLPGVAVNRQHNCGGLSEQRRGGGRFRTLSFMATKLLAWCAKRQVSLTAKFIPSKLNVLANSLSRKGQIIHTEWTLHRGTLSQIFHFWEVPHIDLFATRLNNQLPTFVSPFHDPFAWAVDAMSLSWEGMLAYAFPPIPLLLKVLLKMEKETCLVILIAPCWESHPCFPVLLSLLVAPAIKLPCRRDLLIQPHSRLTHLKPEIFNLHAWLCCREVSRRQNFLKDLLRESVPLKELPHRLSAGLGGSVGCAVRLETRRSRVQPPPRSATFFRGD